MKNINSRGVLFLDYLAFFKWFELIRNEPLDIHVQKDDLVGYYIDDFIGIINIIFANILFWWQKLYYVTWREKVPKKFI